MRESTINCMLRLWPLAKDVDDGNIAFSSDVDVHRNERNI